MGKYKVFPLRRRNACHAVSKRAEAKKCHLPGGGRNGGLLAENPKTEDICAGYFRAKIVERYLANGCTSGIIKNKMSVNRRHGFCSTRTGSAAGNMPHTARGSCCVPITSRPGSGETSKGETTCSQTTTF